jgi:hypothetical protein
VITVEKYKVRRLFVDPETGKSYKKGDTFTGRVERVLELQNAGLLERAPSKTDKANTATEGK